MHFRYRVTMCICLLGVLAALPTVVSAEGSDYSSEHVYRDFVELADAVQSRAMKPPTRQEMLLRGLYGVQAAQGKHNPLSDLASRVSNAKSRAEEQQILSDCLGESTWSKSQRQLFLAASVAWIPGGATLSPLEDLKITRQLRDNLYVGIGIRISKTGQYCVMANVLPRGPARRAKSKDGDKILAVDGVDVRDTDLPDVVGLLRGQRGTKVSVKLQTNDEPPRVVEMVRDIIPIDSVEGVRRQADDEWTYGLSAHPEIAYLRVKQIKSSTVVELRTAARRIARADFRAVILDLTNCAEGEFRYAVMVADAMLGDAPLGAMRTRTGDTKFRSSGEKVFGELPMFVLIDGRTRGVGEWLAAALGDNQRAVLVGSPTAGAGAAPVEVDLKSGFALRMQGGVMVRANGKVIPAGASARLPHSGFERLLQNSAVRNPVVRNPAVRNPAVRNPAVQPSAVRTAASRGVQPDVRVSGNASRLTSVAADAFNKALQEKTPVEKVEGS